MDTLLNQIDNVKTKLTDQEYIELMNSLKKVNEEKENEGLYELTLVVIKARPSDDEDLIAQIYPVVEKRIYKADDFNCGNIMNLKNQYLHINLPPRKIVNAGGEFSYYDCNGSFGSMVFKKHLCLDVKKL